MIEVLWILVLTVGEPSTMSYSVFRSSGEALESAMFYKIGDMHCGNGRFVGDGCAAIENVEVIAATTGRHYKVDTRLIPVEWGPKK